MKRKAFNIPEVKLPSPEKLREFSRNWYDHNGFANIDQWPDEWRAVSMPTHMVALSPDDVAVMWSTWDGAGPQALEGVRHVAEELDRVMNWDEHFIKLNSRSPKDATHPFMPITNAGRQAVAWISLSYNRSLEDAHIMSRIEAPVFICARERVVFWERDEYRCFVKDGEFIALTQYRHDMGVFPHLQLEEYRQHTRALIGTFWREKIAPFSPVKDYVFDVAFMQRDQLILIEVNPYGSSDPCSAKTYEAIEQGGFFYEKPEAT